MVGQGGEPGVRGARAAALQHAEGQAEPQPPARHARTQWAQEAGLPWNFEQRVAGGGERMQFLWQRAAAALQIAASYSPLLPIFVHI